MRLLTWCVLTVGAVLAAGCGSQTVRGPTRVGADAGGDVNVVDTFAADDASLVREDGSVTPVDDARRPQGATCDDAIPVAVGETLQVSPPEAREGSEMPHNGENILAGVFPTRWVRVTVPPRTVVGASIASLPDRDPYSMYGFTRCAADALVALGFHAERDDHARLSWPNTADAPREFYIALLGSRPPTTEVALSVTAVPIASNGFCASPTRAADGAVFPAQDLRRAGDAVGLCYPPTSATAMHAALYYRVHVNAGETLFASMRGTGGTEAFQPLIGWLHVREQCGDAPCLAESNWGLDRWRRVGTVWTNEGASRDVLVTALDQFDSYDHAPTVTFRVAPRATNTRCDAATELLPGVPREVALHAVPRSDVPCALASMRQAAYYTVTLPARATLRVTAEAIEGLNDGVAIQMFEDCDRPACLARAEAREAAMVTATYVGQERETRVVVAVMGAIPAGTARTLVRVTAQVAP